MVSHVKRMVVWSRSFAHSGAIKLFFFDLDASFSDKLVCRANLHHWNLQSNYIRKVLT